MEIRKKIFEILVFLIPVFLYFISVGLYVLSSLSPWLTVQKIADILLLLSLLIILIFAIRYLIITKWIKGLLLLIFFIIAFGISFMASMAVNMLADDNYALDKPIPKNLKFEEPLPDNILLRHEDSLNVLRKNDGTFFLINSWQPGIYEYEYTFKPKEEGTLFLKAFEYTTDDELSSKSFEKDSPIQVEVVSDSLKTFRNKYGITVYEGDWGKYYVARFEIWFTSKATGKSEKINEKIFRICGWQH